MTEDQNVNLQRDASKKYGVEPDRIYEEHISGAKINRPELMSCLRSLREGGVMRSDQQRGRPGFGVGLAGPTGPKGGGIAGVAGPGMAVAGAPARVHPS